jgi:hypothetical protein
MHNINKDLKGKIQLILSSIDYLRTPYMLYRYNILTQEQVEIETSLTIEELELLDVLSQQLKDCNGCENFPEIPSWVVDKFNFYNLLFSKI